MMRRTHLVSALNPFNGRLTRAGKAVSQGKRFAAIRHALLVSVIVAACSFPQSASASVLTLTPVADAYIDKDLPSVNYGKASTLRVDGSPVLRTYVKFDLPSVDAEIAKATLQIYVTDTGGTLTSHPVQDNSWAETSITFNNSPAMGSAASSASPRSLGWTSVDVTPLVRRSGQVSIALTSTSTDGSRFASRETANAPKLVVETGPPSSTPPSGPITASVETQPVPHAGDAADDAAVWIHPTTPSLSTIIGTDKLGSLGVYDLSGKLLHSYSDVKPNNVDIRYNFPLGGQRVTLVAASNRSDDSISIYKVNPTTRGLEKVAARPIYAGIGLYGLCMYHSPTSGRYFVFDTDNSGTVQQWELFDNGAGKVDAKKVRSFGVGSTTEGCVADDELGHFYVSEEDVALWKYGAEPGAGTSRIAVDRAGTGHLTADIEGLTIYYARNGAGYLIASSQGNDRYAIYQRQGANTYVMTFAIDAGTIDGVTHTDGIDVVNFGLGDAFPEGAFIAQDNSNGSSNQNFKLVPWGRIARSSSTPLIIDPTWDPRAVGGSSGGGTPPTHATYYVDAVNGNDTSAGTSETTAWKTLSKASSVTLEPGDRLLLRRGSHWTTRLQITESGTSADPLTIAAYGSGDAPVIKTASTCIDLSGSYVVVQDVHVDDCSWAGIQLVGDHNVVKDSLITHNAAGIETKLGADYNAIINNRIVDNNKMSVLSQSPSNDDSGAFGVLLHGDYTEVAYNTISGSDAFSYDYGRDGAAIEVYGSRYSHIHHNLAVDNDAFTELGDARSADNTYAYNVVTSSLPQSTGVVTRGAASSYGPVARTSLFNNTITMTGSSGQGFVCHAGCSSDILTMRNNIIKATWKVGYADAPFNEDYDIFSGGAVQFTRGSHSSIADPMFVDPAGGNLRLRPSSPAIDRGVDVGYTLDADGTSVPKDGDCDGRLAVDIGAYEYRCP